MFVDIMKGIRILQNMAEYIVEKIVSIEKTLNQKGVKSDESPMHSQNNKVFNDYTTVVVEEKEENYKPFESLDAVTDRIEKIEENQDEKDETKNEDDSAVNAPTHISYTIGTTENDHREEGIGNL